MFVGKGKGENKILKESVWTIIFKIFSPKYLVVRRTTRSQFLVVLTHVLVVEDTRTRKFCHPDKQRRLPTFSSNRVNKSSDHSTTAPMVGTLALDPPRQS